MNTAEAPIEPKKITSPEDLREAGEYLYGSWGWQTKLARQLRVDGSTVRRWISGKIDIPGPAAVAVELLVERQIISERLKAGALIE